MRQVVIVHCHIFKNAGTTIDWIMQRNFGCNFIDHRDNKQMQKGAKYLYDYILERPWLKAVSSHHIKMPLPTIPNVTLLPIFLLRHPIDRAESVYCFERIQRASTPGAMYAKDHSFEEYVAWRMMPDVGATIRNYQVRYCSGRHTATSLGTDDFATAILNLECSPLVGIVDFFDQSMVVMEHQLRNYFDGFDMAYVTQNASERLSVSLTDRLERIQRSVSTSVIDALIRENKLDLELYENAKKGLSSRIEKIPNFNGKLAEYRKRCGQLQGQ